MAKKLIALFVLVATLFVFASCSMPPKLDLEKAADNLEDNDYVVMHTDDEDELEAGMKEMLRAMKMDKDGDDDEYLLVIKFETFKLAKLYYKQLKLQFKTEKDEYEAEIAALKLEIKTAKYELKKYDDDSAWDEDDIDELEEELEELQEEFKKFKKEGKFGIIGKTVWTGTAKAFKDSKKS